MIFALLALLLAGCCANEVCECDDAGQDALYFRFKVGDARDDFSTRELDTLRLLRYNRDSLDFPRSRHDSVLVTGLGTRLLVIDNAAPFTLATNRKLNDYDYLIRLRDGTRRYTIRGITLRGRFEGDGCCTCYQNVRKTATVTSYLNGLARLSAPYDATAVNQQRVVFELTKAQ